MTPLSFSSWYAPAIAGFCTLIQGSAPVSAVPKLIVFDLEHQQLLIDGREFPCAFADDWTVTADHHLAIVKLTLFADAVEIRPEPWP